MRALTIVLMVAGGAGALATIALAAMGDTPGATRLAGIAASVLVLGMVLHRR